MGFHYLKSKMFKNISIPPSFSLIKKGKVILLLKEEYKNVLLQQGIDHIKTFLKCHDHDLRYVIGRTPHPSILLKDGERMIIRFYSHGGLFRFFSRNLYFLGSRSLRELTLTEEIRSCKIPTIQPVGAIHHFIFPPLYRAYFLSLVVPGAMDLTQYFKKSDLTLLLT